MELLSENQYSTSSKRKREQKLVSTYLILLNYVWLSYIQFSKLSSLPLPLDAAIAISPTWCSYVQTLFILTSGPDVMNKEKFKPIIYILTYPRLYIYMSKLSYVLVSKVSNVL